ncbi:hypothetical protein ACVWXN_000152 [Bradyrhizobium sp. i1.4.4]
MAIWGPELGWWGRFNERGYRTRLGARFGVATIHGSLTNAIYIGDSVFNRRDSRTLKQKPVKEHVATEVPAIISKAAFEAVAANLRVRNSRTTAPRVVTGPILLPGVAVCGSCDGAMTLSGRYRMLRSPLGMLAASQRNAELRCAVASG